MFKVSKTEVERLLQMLKQQCPNSPKIRMDRNKFNDFVHKNFEMTDEMIVDRGKPFTLFEALRSEVGTSCGSILIRKQTTRRMPCISGLLNFKTSF